MSSKSPAMTIFTTQPMIQTKAALPLLSKFMTTLRSDEKEFGEPLAAIYEPRMYPRMLHALGLGYSCPTKVLRNSNREEIEVTAKTVNNINTKEEFEKVKSDLS